MQYLNPMESVVESCTCLRRCVDVPMVAVGNEDELEVLMGLSSDRSDDVGHICWPIRGTDDRNATGNRLDRLAIRIMVVSGRSIPLVDVAPISTPDHIDRWLS